MKRKHKGLQWFNVASNKKSTMYKTNQQYTHINIFNQITMSAQWKYTICTSEKMLQNLNLSSSMRVPSVKEASSQSISTETKSQCPATTRMRYGRWHVGSSAFYLFYLYLFLADNKKYFLTNDYEARKSIEIFSVL